MSVKFDLIEISTHFTDSLINDSEDVHMDSYIKGFWEINKFFHVMGSVFSFVSSDVESKLEILEDFRKTENGDKFKTFKTMMEYEKSNGLLTKHDYVSGSRTLLRLHRGLEFISEFLDKLHSLPPDGCASNACQNAYDLTLAKYHPWYIRTGAGIAMYALPKRNDLLKKLGIEIDEVDSVLPDMLKITKTVHECTDQLYSEYDLHDLP